MHVICSSYRRQQRQPQNETSTMEKGNGNDKKTKQLQDCIIYNLIVQKQRAPYYDPNLYSLQLD